MNLTQYYGDFMKIIFGYKPEIVAMFGSGNHKINKHISYLIS
jgi:hypothetical protein